MSYVNTKVEAKRIREELKEAFPSWKFSVTTDHNCITIAIMKATIKFSDKDYEQLNPFYLGDPSFKYQNVEVLKWINNRANLNNYSNNDLQSGYYDVGFYFNFDIGKWNVPFQLISE